MQVEKPISRELPFPPPQANDRENELAVSTSSLSAMQRAEALEQSYAENSKWTLQRRASCFIIQQQEAESPKTFSSALINPSIKQLRIIGESPRGKELLQSCRALFFDSRGPKRGHKRPELFWQQYQRGLAETLSYLQRYTGELQVFCRPDLWQILSPLHGQFPQYTLHKCPQLSEPSNTSDDDATSAAGLSQQNQNSHSNFRPSPVSSPVNWGFFQVLFHSDSRGAKPYLFLLRESQHQQILRLPLARTWDFSPSYELQRCKLLAKELYRLAAPSAAEEERPHALRIFTASYPFVSSAAFHLHSRAYRMNGAKLRNHGPKQSFFAKSKEVFWREELPLIQLWQAFLSEIDMQLELAQNAQLSFCQTLRSEVERKLRLLRRGSQRAQRKQFSIDRSRFQPLDKLRDARSFWRNFARYSTNKPDSFLVLWQHFIQTCPRGIHKKLKKDKRICSFLRKFSPADKAIPPQYLLSPMRGRRLYSLPILDKNLKSNDFFYKHLQIHEEQNQIQRIHSLEKLLRESPSPSIFGTRRFSIYWEIPLLSLPPFPKQELSSFFHRVQRSSSIRIAATIQFFYKLQLAHKARISRLQQSAQSAADSSRQGLAQIALSIAQQKQRAQEKRRLWQIYFKRAKLRNHDRLTALQKRYFPARVSILLLSLSLLALGLVLFQDQTQNIKEHFVASISRPKPAQIQTKNEVTGQDLSSSNTSSPPPEIASPVSQNEERKATQSPEEAQTVPNSNESSTPALPQEPSSAETPPQKEQEVRTRNNTSPPPAEQSDAQPPLAGDAATTSTSSKAESQLEQASSSSRPSTSSASSSTQKQSPASQASTPSSNLRNSNIAPLEAPRSNSTPEQNSKQSSGTSSAEQKSTPAANQASKPSDQEASDKIQSNEEQPSQPNNSSSSSDTTNKPNAEASTETQAIPQNETDASQTKATEDSTSEESNTTEEAPPQR